MKLETILDFLCSYKINYGMKKITMPKEMIEFYRSKIICPDDNVMYTDVMIFEGDKFLIE